MRLNTTYLNKMKKMYSPNLVSVVQLVYFVVLGGFSGICRSFPLFVYRKLQQTPENHPKTTK